LRNLLVEAARSDTSGLQEPDRLTVRDLAVELRCSEEDVRALIREGELRTVACGIRPGLVPRHELEAYRRRLQHRARRT
jgi:excisionase family DNA binding protein